MSWLALIACNARRTPAVALGLAWIGIAILPVSNLLTPTGVVIAERTLFLPSAGMMLALGGGWEWVRAGARPGFRTALTAGTAILVALGVLRSTERAGVWRDQDRFMTQLMIDAPTVSRAHKLMARHLTKANRRKEAEAAWQRAYGLFQGDPEVHEELGQVYRASGRCQEALPVFDSGLRNHPDRTTLRSRYIECLLFLGDTAAARSLALDAVEQGYPEFEQTVRRLSVRP
jgi:tetratricopeptide (TPR) repeat protein